MQLISHKLQHRNSLQRGISLIESLVAIVVMALGIFGIMGVQMRTLADTQTGVRRAQAIRLIEDLSERVRANPNAMGTAGDYAIAWDATLGSPNSCLIDDFIASNCTPAQLTAFDRDRWIRSVRANLPLGDASIFISDSDPRQLGVMVSWRQNEREGANAADTLAYSAPFVTSSTGGAGISCPDKRICHLQYIALTQRCIPQGTLVVCSGA